MNYTYYNKLKLFADKSNDEITKEIFRVSKAVTSYWGYTVALKKYIGCLKSFKLLNRLHLKFLKNIVLFINKIKFDKKIRVLFIVNEYSVFPSVKSVYDTMMKDNTFICDLVHVPFNHTNKTKDSSIEINDYINKCYNEIIEYNKYNLTKRSPDIVIYLKPYDLIPEQFYVYEIEKVVEHIIYIPYYIHSVKDDELYKYAYQLPIQDKAWINVSHSEKHQQLAKKYSNTKGKNFYLIGHPRMDLIYDDYTNNDFYKEIKRRANGRKIFLYDPHHAVNEQYKWGTFKIYGLDILKYFKDNRDIFLLYRPHPLLYGALKKEYGDDFFKKYDELLNSENILYDDTSDYLVSMHVSDYLISDANSFIPEFSMYNKPVIYTKYPGYNKIDEERLLEIIYTANNFKEIIKHINNLKNGKDDLRSKRKKLIKSYFKFDKNKTVSQKLIEKIKEEFIKEKDIK